VYIYIYIYIYVHTYTHKTNYHIEISSEISTVTLWHSRQIDLHNTICNGINLRDKNGQTGLEDMVSQFGYTVNVVEENVYLATVTKSKK